MLIDQRLNFEKVIFFFLITLSNCECRFSMSLRKSILSRTFHRQLQQWSSPPSVMNKTAHSQKFPPVIFLFRIQNGTTFIHVYICIYYITGYTIVRIYKKPNVPLTFIKTSLLRVRKGTFLLLSLTTRVQEARWADSTLKGSTRDKREEG